MTQVIDQEPEGYYTKERHSVMPEYNIEKIFVSENELKVLCSLQRDPDLNYDAWIGSSEFIKYINFYFLVVKSPIDPGSFNQKIYYPTMRVFSFADNPSDLKNWERFYTDNRRRLNNGIKGSLKVNMSEILIDRYKKADNPVFIDDEITIDTNHYFEISIALDKDWQRGSGTALSLYSFSQLDIKELSGPYGLSNFMGKLSEYGGHLLYEKVLEKSNPGGWMVPDKVHANFDEFGNPFNGLIHLHNGQSAPLGYTGYLSGPPGSGLMFQGEQQNERDSLGRYKDADPNWAQNRKRITRRQILNTKVISNTFLEYQMGFDGKRLSSTDGGLNAGSRYSGFSMGDGMVDTDPRRYASPYGNLTFGRDLLTTLKAEIGLSKLSAENSTYLETDRANSRYSLYHQKMKHLAITKERGNNLNISSNPAGSSWLQLNSGFDAHYGSIFMLNIEQMIKSNSKYGYFLDFHREALPDSLGNLRPHARKSLEFIQRAIRESKIYCLKFYRKRVTNNPISNTRLGTADYRTYDTDLPEEYVIETRTSGNRSSLQATKNNKAEISPLREMLYDKSGYKSIISLRDYDLFNTKTHGTYKYIVEVSMTDGIRKVLNLMCEDFEKAIGAFSKYIDEASTPTISKTQEGYYVGNQFAATFDRFLGQSPSTGNYNYLTEQFSPRFKRRKEEFRTMVESIVNQYVDIVYLLSQRINIMNDQVKENLINMLLPDKAGIGNLNFFLDLCMKLESRLKSIVYDSASSKKDHMNLGNKVKNVSADPTYPDMFIRVKGDLNNVIKIVSKNTVFYTPDINTVSPGFATGAGSTAGMGAGFIMLATEEDTQSKTEIIAGTETPITRTRTRHMIKAIDSATGGNAVMMAAARAGSISKEPTNNQVEVLNGILTSFGATFNDLLSSTFSTQEGKTTCGTDKTRYFTPDLEASVLNSIISSDKKEHFVREIESTHKEFYFRKERLGDIYDTVVSFMANAKTRKKTEKQITYAERVATGKTTSEISLERSTETERKGIVQGIEVSRLQLMSDGSFHAAPTTTPTSAQLTNDSVTTNETEASSATGTGIYFYETSNDSDPDFLKTKTVNNVVIETAATPEDSVSSTASTANSTSAAFGASIGATLGSGAGTQSSGPSTTGGYS